MGKIIKTTYSDIKNAVRQQLVIIGKHHKAQAGGTLFSTTTLSEIDQNVVPDLIVAAAQAIVGELSPMVTAYYKTDESMTFSVDDTCIGEALPQALTDSIRAYIVASVVQSVLNMSVPDITPKYAVDTQQQLASLTKMAFNKKTPIISDEILNVSGSVKLESEETADGYTGS